MSNMLGVIITKQKNEPFGREFQFDLYKLVLRVRNSFARVTFDRNLNRMSIA